jgi:hypothetical protein
MSYIQTPHLHSRLLRRRIAQRPTLPTRPRPLIRLKRIHRFLDLRPQIRAMETLLMHLLPTALTIPAQPIQAALRPLLLQHDAHRVREPDGIVWGVRRQQEHVALVDEDVAVLFPGRVRRVDDFQEHAAFVLVEPFGGFVDVVVCAGVGAADDHDGDGVVVDAVVVYGGLQHVGVFGDPGETSVSTMYGGLE